TRSKRLEFRRVIFRSVVSIRAALATPIFTVEVANAGPGGLHRHAITAGANAVCARLSTTGEDHADLAGSLFPVLLGEMTRLVRRAEARGACRERCAEK